MQVLRQNVFMETPEKKLTLVLLITAFANSVDPDQLASKKPTDLYLLCLPFSMWIYIHNMEQVIWLKIWKRHGILIYSAGQGLTQR